MALTTRSTARLLTRPANVTAGPLPDAWIDETLATLDEGTKRAILRLYRSSPADVLAAAGRRLATIDVPALVAWGMTATRSSGGIRVRLRERPARRAARSCRTPGTGRGSTTRTLRAHRRVPRCRLTGRLAPCG